MATVELPEGRRSPSLLARVNRRQFMKVGIGVAALAALAGCQPSQPPAPPTSAPAAPTAPPTSAQKPAPTLAPTAAPAPAPTKAPAAAPTAAPKPPANLESLGKDPRMIVHTFEPSTIESPLHLIQGSITPNQLFFVRSHDVTPKIDLQSWKLEVAGHVNRPYQIGLDELTRMPSRSVVGFLECSGNSRSRFSPQATGTQWGNGAVGCAEWTGVPLAAVLERAGVKPGAVDVVSAGDDGRQVTRGLPLAVARDQDVLVAYAMNGAPLPAPHGGPVRLFVPRWGGIASIKWLKKLEVIDKEFDGPFNKQSYVLIDQNGDVKGPVTEMPVKSAIVLPQPRVTLAPGVHVIRGFAWSGRGAISKMEVSVDGGRNWQPADFSQAQGPLAWAPFSFRWEVREAGTYTLASRATDSANNTQPNSTPWNRLGYQMNAVYELPVQVGTQPAPTVTVQPAATKPAAQAPAPTSGAAQASTVQQVASGSQVYTQSCQACHGANLEGGAGPKLAVENLSSYGDAQKLVDFAGRAMPYNAPGSLEKQQTYDVVAYVLDKLGLLPSGQALGPDTAARIAIKKP